MLCLFLKSEKHYFYVSPVTCDTFLPTKIEITNTFSIV